MFTILGADQKEYGPVSADEIKQWIAEGRADAQTFAKAESDSEWRPLAVYPEFAEALAAAGPASHHFATDPGQPPAIEELAARDYDLDVLSCIRRAWELTKQNLWAVVGINFLVFILLVAVSAGLDLISGPVLLDMLQQKEVPPERITIFIITRFINVMAQYALIGGLYRYFLKLIRGQAPDVADAFYGVIHVPGQLALLALLMTLLIALGIIACVIPGIYLSVAWFFALPLLVDRKIGVWEAMQLSMMMVNKHWFLVFLLIIVSTLLSLCGLLAACIGIFVSAPVGYIALLYGYEDIFGRRAR